MCFFGDLNTNFDVRKAKSDCDERPLIVLSVISIKVDKKTFVDYECLVLDD